ncbi:MAG TPA: AEC family transporter [Conexibacter sp.]
MIEVVVTVVLAVAAGIALERRTPPGTAQVLRHYVTRLLLWVLTPFVAFVSIARLHAGASVALGIAVGLSTTALVTTLMWLYARGPLGLDRRSIGAAMICTTQGNTGYFGLPLCAALFSATEFSQSVAYDSFVSLPAFVFGSFTIGAIFGTQRGEASFARHLSRTLFKNPLPYVLVAALLVPSSWAPSLLDVPLDVAVFSLAPLGFLIVGLTLADETAAGDLRIPPALTRPIGALIALRMVLMPAIVLAFSLLVVRLPATYPLMAAMPTGVNTIVVAHRTGLDLRLTADGNAWTTSIALAATLAVAILLALGVL